MEPEHALIKLEAYRVGDAGCMSGIGGNGFERHRVEFLRNAFIVKNVSCRNIAIPVFSLIRYHHDGGG